MRLASLYSGGKDSTYSTLLARETGHEILCLITMHPAADDSLLFHYPNSRITRYLSEAMGIPLVEYSVGSASKEDEMQGLESAIAVARTSYGIDGIVFGGISSLFQKRAFEEICARHNLATVAPVWGLEPVKYMNELLRRGFKVMIVRVSAMGLGKEWLGKVIDRESLAKLGTLARKHGFNLNFEGGEAETLVLDCPLFQKALEVRRARMNWDGQRGIFEIQEAALVEK